MPEAGAFMAGAIVSKLLMDKSGWDSSIRAVKKDEENLTGAAGRIGRGFQQAGAIMAVAGGAVAASVGLMVSKVAEEGNALALLSEKTGVAANLLSGYKLAADLSGASVEDLGIGLQIMARNALDAATQGGSFKKKFDMMGVSVTDVKGRIRPMNDLLLDLADAFAKLPDGTAKTAMAMELFGRSGTNLIPMLNLGRKGLLENYQMAQKLGRVYSEEDAKAADKLNGTLEELQAGFKGITQQIAIGALPTMTKYATMARDVVASIVGWIQQNGPLASTLLTAAGATGAFTAALGTGLLILGSLITKLGVVAGALGMTGAALMASTILFSAGFAAAGIYALKLWEVAKAEEAVQAADRQLQETQNSLVDKLSAAATAAGWNVGRMAQLIEAYKGNVAALTMAIKAGEYGKDIQEGLAKASAQHTAKIEDQKKKMAEAALAAAGLTDQILRLGQKTETLAEKLNLLTFEKITKQIQDNRKALAEYEGKMPTAETARLTKETQDLEDSLNPIPGLLKQVGDAAKDAADTGMFSLEEMLKNTGDVADYEVMTWKKLNEDLDASWKVVEAGWKKDQETGTKTVKKETGKQHDYYAGLYNDIARGLSDTIEKIINGQEKFGAFFKSFWQTIKKSFARVLAEMVSDYVVKFIKQIIEKTGMLKALGGIFDSIFGAIFGKAASGAIAGTAGGAAGAAGTAGAAGAAGGFLSGLAIPIAFGAVFLGTLFGKLFGKSAFSKIYEAWNQHEKDMWDKAVREGTLLGTIARNQLQKPKPGTPVSGSAKTIGSMKPDEEEWLWSIYGGGKHALAGEGSTPVSLGDSPGGIRRISPITVNVNLTGTLITDRDFVRSRLIKEIQTAFEGHVLRTKMQKALGIG